jgi:hypothetical protein
MFGGEIGPRRKKRKHRKLVMLHAAKASLSDRPDSDLECRRIFRAVRNPALQTMCNRPNIDNLSTSLGRLIRLPQDEFSAEYRLLSRRTTTDLASSPPPGGQEICQGHALPLSDGSEAPNLSLFQASTVLANAVLNSVQVCSWPILLNKSGSNSR